MPYKNPGKQREYQRNWKAQRRRAYFDGKCCAQCGSDVGLELDHKDPATKVDHKIWSWSEERRSQELDKCQPLCGVCHKRKTLREMPVTHGFSVNRHGSPGMYRRGCRCGLCRLQKRNYRLVRGAA